MVTLPKGSEYGTIINVPDFNLQPGVNLNRDRDQNVPANAPPGNYNYDAYIGSYPDLILDEDAIKLVRKRIGNLPLLSDEMIVEIFKKSKYNPRKLLANCEDVCKQAIDNFDDAVAQEHIDEILK